MRHIGRRARNVAPTLTGTLVFSAAIGSATVDAVTAAPAASPSVSGSYSLLLSASSPAASCSFFMPSSCFSAARRAADISRQDIKAAPLTFEERRARRTPKTRDQRMAAEAVQLEAEQYVESVLPDELSAEEEKLMGRVDAIVQKLLHPTAAIEALQVEVSGAKKPLLQLATIVKASARTIEIIPKSSAFATPILVRLTKHDKALAPRKEDAKITLTLPPLTRQRRAYAQEEIKTVQTDLATRMRLLRKHALLHVQELGLGEDALRALALDVEAKIEQGQSAIAQRMTDQIDELSGTADEEEDEAALDEKK